MTGRLRTAARAAGRGVGRGVGIVDLPYSGIRRENELLCLNTDGRIVVRGRPRHAVRPSLHGTSFYGEMSVNVWQAAYFAARRHGKLVPHRVSLGGRTVAEVEREGYEAARVAVEAAGVAAARVLGETPRLTGSGARVLAVVTGSPPAAVLAPGDVVTAVAGRRVRTADELTAVAVAALRGGGPLPLTVLRAQAGAGDGVPAQLQLDPPATEGGSRPLGVRVVTHRTVVDNPLDVDVALPADHAGPSLGLMLTLAIVDVCTPGELTGGVPVAGTGTVDVRGRVGQVGGVDYKASSARRAGMRLFLVPPGQGGEARAAAAGLEVVEVGRVDEALEVLRSRF